MTVALCLWLPLAGMAANKKQKVTQVTEAVTVTDDLDYIVTGATPFAEGASVDLVNTEHAVLILNTVKPSAAIRLLAKNVMINGAKAVNNSNCQVKIYNRGSIILPYGNNTKPLTVFPEQNFGGEGVNNFGLGNSGGYMNTLTAAQLNNKIRSFKLKRGYMVTFSTQSGGRGYSRCFIAANSDLEIAELPPVLDQKISSYRIFKWYDTGKKQLANSAGSKDALDALNVQSTYDWGQGNTSLQPDYEWVPNHIYEDWPSSSSIGGTTQSPHTKNNNEPRNSADDRPQDLKTILDNWENMMRTGLRLCSPASWDGSDYTNATGFLAEFLDSIDARAWRCDIIDLHCYWAEGTFNNIANWTNKYKRPVWISEWCWGASWNKNGAFASGVTRAQVKTALQSICGKLNNWDYVERYYYWNNEASISKLYENGKLTPAGEYYSGMTTTLGYNGKYDFVPTTPRQYAPSRFKTTTSNGKVVVSWYDANGEYNQLMEVQRKVKGGQWETLSTVEQKETAANYTFTDDEAPEGALYRVHLRDLNGRDYFTNNNMEAGDAVTTADGKTLYVGGNLLLNGDFNFGTEGWTSGTGAAIGQPYFQVVPVGGIDGGSYLQAYGNGGMDAVSSLKKVVNIQPEADYYFRVASRNAGTYQKVSLTENGKTEAKNVLTMENTTDWLYQDGIFNSGSYKQALIAFRWLGAKGQLDKMELRRLFSTYEEAVADGAPLDQAYMAAKEAHDAIIQQQRADSLALVSEALKAMDCPLEPADLALIQLSGKIKQYNLKAETGWNVKAGTYKNGDQRLNTVGGKSCWNAWWSGVNASTGAKQTMEINQQVTGLPEGAYFLECKATTQHYCISDQHGFITYEGETVTTPTLQADYFDLPTVGNIWQTLTSTPIYIKEGGTATIGFKNSKVGAVDNAWHEYGNADSKGDRREGWWCATEFRLRYQPAYSLSSDGPGWGTICLSRNIIKPNDVMLFRIVGITADNSQFCIEEVAEPAAGVPYIYYADKANPRFFMKGDEKTDAVSGDGNLKGYLKVAAGTTAPIGSYTLANNGAWFLVENEQTAVSSNTAVVTSLEGLPVIDNWQGLTMNLGTALAVSNIPSAATPKTNYTIGGQRTTNGRGIIIESDGRQSRKVIRR